MRGAARAFQHLSSRATGAHPPGKARPDRISIEDCGPKMSYIPSCSSRPQGRGSEPACLRFEERANIVC